MSYSTIEYSKLVLEASGREELLKVIEERNASGNYPLIFSSSDDADDYIRKSFEYAVGPSFNIHDYEIDFDETIDAFIDAIGWCREQFGPDALRGVVCSFDPGTQHGFEEVDLSAAWAFDASDFIMYFHNERDAVLYRVMKGF